MREFWGRGYRETSVADLVEATGVPPGSLYTAFPGGKRGCFWRRLPAIRRLWFRRSWARSGARVRVNATQVTATSMGLMVVGKTDPGREVLEAIVDAAFADLG
jgi:AcrR family transcriptional regulator